MTCDLAKKQLPLHLYGELNFGDEEALETHLETCAGCRDELNALKTLHRLARETEAKLPTGLMESCRAGLRERIAAEPPARRAGWWARVRCWRPVVVAWRPAGALALLALGFFAARLSGPAPFTGARVRYVEPEESGRVQIVLEETRQRVMTGRLEEAPIRKLLLAAATDREDPGLRVESIDILKSQSASAEVRGALLQALRSDPDAGVRMKAIEGLKTFGSDAETRKAVAQVLLTDENPAVRTMAVDLLVERKQQDLVGVLQQLLRKENNDYIRERSARALREMRASVETF